MNWRRAAVLGGAALLGLAAGAAAQQLEGTSVKGFRLPEYDEAGKLKQQLYGETATFLEGGIIQLTGLKIEIFSKGAVSARIHSPLCAYDPERKRAASQDHIRIVVEKGVLTGDGFAWNGENEQFQIFRNVKVTLDSQLDEDLMAPRTAAAEAAAEPAGEEAE